ncbi:MAG: hypothetical protein R3C56_21460 [Pirellulaceae bacterium]
MLTNNKIVDLGPLVEMAEGDSEHRFAPFWNVYLAGNPLGDTTAAQLEKLKQFGVRIHLK